MQETYDLRPIGRVSSTLKTPEQAPRQGSEGAPDAWLELDAPYARAVEDIAVGDTALVITWLHLADRSVLEVHPATTRTIR